MIAGSDRFRQFHVGALAMAAIMLPWSEFLLSVAQFALLGNWIAEGVVRKDLAGRFRRAFTHPACLVFVSFFALHVFGLLWTTDLQWGLDLCRILLPVLAFAPVLCSSTRLTAAESRVVLVLGAWATVASTITCLALKYDVIGNGGYRELSIFISHIRLSLLLCFSIAVFVHYARKSWFSLVAHGAAVAWCLFFLDRLSSLLGLGILALLLVWAVWRWSIGQGPVARWSTRTVLVLLTLCSALYVRWCVIAYEQGDDIRLDQLEVASAGGEVYYHDLLDPQRENGHYVWIYCADKELQRTWDRRSHLPFAGNDAAGQPIRSTLIRYLASMGLRKDSLGVLALEQEDIDRIEQGVTSVVSGRRDPVRARIDQVLYELEYYERTGNANGHSVAMRIEFLRAAWSITKANWLTGVGTGDTRGAFAAEYDRSHSLLEDRWRLRAHNEYLTLWISFGVFGLLWSVLSWVWPARALGAFRHPLFVCWVIIFAVSCISEDTLETQMGATFFAFYYAYFVFAAPPRSLEGEQVAMPQPR
jgi:hypothetical protein